MPPSVIAVIKRSIKAEVGKLASLAFSAQQKVIRSYWRRNSAHDMQNQGQPAIKIISSQVSEKLHHGIDKDCHCICFAGFLQNPGLQGCDCERYPLTLQDMEADNYPSCTCLLPCHGSHCHTYILINRVCVRNLARTEQLLHFGWCVSSFCEINNVREPIVGYDI